MITSVKYEINLKIRVYVEVTLLKSFCKCSNAFTSHCMFSGILIFLLQLDS